ncbi:hypothetical protein ACFLT9_13115 [Acidobacteriota bacterium]
MRHTPKFFLVLTAAILMATLPCRAEEEMLIGARFPSLSPDGTQIAFSYMGDLWIVSVKGGKASKLTDHLAYDRNPIWSPDGQLLAFTSNRQGNKDVYVIPVGGGTPLQLTYHTGNDTASDFSPDGSSIIFESSRSSSASIFKIGVGGGNAVPLLDTYWSWPHFARVKPDGKGILFALGMEHNSWWRRGYKGSNTSKIWEKDYDSQTATQIFSDKSNCFWPHWNDNGAQIFFVSDREYGTKNIWKINRDGSGLEAVTRFEKNDITWFSVAADSPLAVYERNFGIWITDLQSGSSSALNIDAPAETKGNKTFFVNNENVSEFRLSPDGKKIAAVVRGDVFILSSEGGYARNITETPWRERYVEWDRDSRNIYFVSDKGANPELYIMPALGTATPKRLTESEEDEISPRVSPDGKWLAYFSGKRQLRLMNIETKEDILLFEGDIYGLRASPPEWSPDSRYVAIEVNRNANGDLFALDIQTKEKILLTNTAYDEGGPLWSTDGKFMLFTSNRFGHSFPEFTGKWDLYQLHLKPRDPEFDETEFEKLFEEKKEDKEETKKEPAEVKVDIELEDIDLQTQTVTNTLGNDNQIILSSKDNKTIYFTSSIDGRYHLWTTSLDKEKRGQYEPFMPSISSPGQMQPDSSGKYLYYLSRGRIGRIDLAGKKNKSISLSTKIEVDKTADYKQMLSELYYTLKYYYYDENFHDVDWTALYHEFLPVLQQVREDSDFYDYANLMIGFLNSSHTGIRAPPPREERKNPVLTSEPCWN